MARTYKRDKIGRFAAKGSGGGGKLGKSEKNEKARARYKKSKANLSATKEVYGGNSPAAKSKGAAKAIGAAKSGMTRTTKNLQGGASRQGSFKDLGRSKATAKAAPAKSERKAARPPKGGNTRSTSTKPVMKPQDKARAASAANARKIKADMGPKVKAADKRAKDLNSEANRLDRAYQRQAKATKANPTKENKARLKEIQSQTRMADRAAKRADKEANKLANQLERKLTGRKGMFGR